MLLQSRITEAEWIIPKALQGLGNATPDAIRGDLLIVEGVLSVTVFENDTDITNAAGLPPHSLEGVVLQGDDVAVAANAEVTLSNSITATTARFNKGEVIEVTADRDGTAAVGTWRLLVSYESEGYTA